MAAQREAGLLANGGDAMKARVETKPEVDEQKITLAEAGIDKNLADRARGQECECSGVGHIYMMPHTF